MPGIRCDRAALAMTRWTISAHRSGFDVTRTPQRLANICGRWLGLPWNASVQTTLYTAPFRTHADPRVLQVVVLGRRARQQYMPPQPQN